MRRFATIENLFFLVIFSLPLYLLRVDVFGLPTNISELLAVLAIIFWFVKERKDLAAKLSGIPRLIRLSIALIVVGALLSILSNNAHTAGFGILKGWFLIPILFAYALYTFLNSRVALEKVFYSIFLSVSLVGIIGIVYKIAGIVTYDNRLAAFYQSPNYLAMYLAPGIFFGIYFLLKSFSQKRFSGLFFPHLALLVIILIPLYYTYSYGAWIAIAGALLITVALAAPQKKYLLAGLLIAIAGIILVFQTNTQKFSQLAQWSGRSSLASRTMIWRSSLLMIEQSPILGIGPGNFQATYLSLQKYFPPYLEWAVPQPHNLFLAFWLQTGILGLTGFFLLLIWVFRTLASLLKNKKGAAPSLDSRRFRLSTRGGLAAPLFGFFLYTVLHGLIDTPYWKNDLAFLFWICVFLTLTLRKNLGKSKE